MAIKNSIVKMGVKVNACYIRVISVNMSKDSAQCSVSYHADETSESFAVEQFSFIPNLDGENAISQSYNYLKTLPEFSTAKDV